MGHSGGAGTSSGERALCSHPNNFSFLPTETTIKQLDPYDMDEVDKLAAE